MPSEIKKGSDNYEQKKEQIREAARDIFAYYGYNKTTLDDISQKVGIKKNSIYYYFKSKEELFNEILTEIFETKISEYYKKSSNAKNSIDKIKIFVLSIVSQEYKKSKEYNITPSAFLEIWRVIDESYKEIYENTHLLLNSILKEGIKNGEFKRHNTNEVANIILEYLQALQILEYSKATTKFISLENRKKLEERLNFFIDLIYSGIQNIK